MSRLARIALLAAMGDALTKTVAATWLADGRWGQGWIHLLLVHNDQGAFSLSAGEYTWQINLALTICALALIVPVSRALERVDPLAPEALGLVAGGAIGNLASLILSPFGVLDFIALRTSADSAIVLNAADIAAYAGLAMLARTMVRLVGAIREQSRRDEYAYEPAMSVNDAELPRVVWVEPSVERARETRRQREEKEVPRPPAIAPELERTDPT